MSVNSSSLTGVVGHLQQALRRWQSRAYLSEQLRRAEGSVREDVEARLAEVQAERDELERRLLSLENPKHE